MLPKGKWEPPTERLLSGLWDFKDHPPTGGLEFDFTLDPLTYKEEQKKLKKLSAAAEAEGKKIDPEAFKPKPKEPITI